MIFLFDNCYLSTADQIVEDAKHVWIGEFENKHEATYAFDTHKVYDSITYAKLETLFKDIHQKLIGNKVIIYADIPSYQFIYSTFFKAFLSTDSVKELYKYDVQKENFRIGSYVYGANVGFRDYKTIELPETLTVARKASEFAKTLGDYRIEVAFANGLLGDETLKQFTIDRVTKMYKGTYGINKKMALLCLPAILDDSEYKLDNITNQIFIDSKLEEVEQPLSKAPNTKGDNIFGFDYVVYGLNVINNNGMSLEECYAWWDKYSTIDKVEVVKQFLLNPDVANNVQLVFPNVSNFDTMNPILWNAILSNFQNTEWLEKFRVINGTDNQTDGTV